MGGEGLRNYDSYVYITVRPSRIVTILAKQVHGNRSEFSNDQLLILADNVYNIVNTNSIINLHVKFSFCIFAV